MHLPVLTQPNHSQASHHAPQKIFDNLQASADINTDVATEEANIFFRAASNHTNLDSLLKDDKELAFLFEMLATPSKKKPTSRIPVGLVGHLPPPVRFCRTNRNSIPSK